MSKKPLYALLIFDLLLIVGSIYVIFNELSVKKSFQLFSDARFQQNTPVRSEPLSVQTGELKQQDASELIPSKAVQPPKRNIRNIRFTYRNSRPKTVALTGEFNDWKPLEMTKDEQHIWSISVELKPGEYLYGYLVDGRFINDPNNPRIKTGTDGRKNSLITVKPL